MLGNFSWESPRFFVTDHRGYSELARHVAKHVLHREPEECRGFRFNKTVTRVTHAEDRCQAQTSDGTTYTARRCILTFSSGVVNAALDGGGLFLPELPDWKAEAYRKAQQGIYTKIFLKYNRSFWADVDYALFADPEERGSYAVWQSLESQHKFLPEAANMLMVTVVQDQSKRVETQPTAITVSQIQKVLATMYGDIPEPVSVLVPRWHADPAFVGCWSNVDVGAGNDADFEALQRNVGGLYFSGEATDPDFNGFTLGGFTSGQRAAKSVVESLA
eukprot:TRINITY_DN10190_c0_g1_i6.p1 TRINITY_DN10190_c0_g1~~TRINITY_DN10190_c0_g1_i6.p1  ORF type:complete len:275 (+),score=56.25 TRINITY_DN10190_c0_g1_i6:775-1599(+)